MEDATLAGGAAPAVPPSKPKVEYRDKLYSEKLKCMDDSHSERCRYRPYLYLFKAVNWICTAFDQNYIFENQTRRANKAPLSRVFLCLVAFVLRRGYF